MQKYLLALMAFLWIASASPVKAQTSNLSSFEFTITLKLKETTRKKVGYTVWIKGPYAIQKMADKLTNLSNVIKIHMTQIKGDSEGAVAIISLKEKNQIFAQHNLPGDWYKITGQISSLSRKNSKKLVEILSIPEPGDIQYIRTSGDYLIIKIKIESVSPRLVLDELVRIERDVQTVKGATLLK